MEPPQLVLGPKRADPLRSGALFQNGVMGIAAGQGGAGDGAPPPAASGDSAFRSPVPRPPSALQQPRLSGPRGDVPHSSSRRADTPLALAPLVPAAAQPYADAAAFNRSEVAERIRRSFDAMVARSPIGDHFVRNGMEVWFMAWWLQAAARARCTAKQTAGFVAKSSLSSIGQ